MFRVICSECGTAFKTESHEVAMKGLCDEHA